MSRGFSGDGSGVAWVWSVLGRECLGIGEVMLESGVEGEGSR